MAEVRRGPVRQRLAAPPLDAVKLTLAQAGAQARRRSCKGSLQGHPRAQARRLAADHDRRGRRLARHDAASTARRCARGSASSTRGRTSPRSAARRRRKPRAERRRLRRRDDPAALVRRRGAATAGVLRGTRRSAGAARGARAGPARARRGAGRDVAHRRRPRRGALPLCGAARRAPTASSPAAPRAPPSAIRGSAGVDAHDGLGDADRLLGALALEGDLEDVTWAPPGMSSTSLTFGAHADLRGDRHRRREADLVEPVVEREGEALELEDLVVEARAERERVGSRGRSCRRTASPWRARRRRGSTGGRR